MAVLRRSPGETVVCADRASWAGLRYVVETGFPVRWMDDLQKNGSRVERSTTMHDVVNEHAVTIPPSPGNKRRVLKRSGVLVAMGLAAVLTQPARAQITADRLLRAADEPH